MMDELDTDRDGYVDLGEFAAFHGHGRGERELDAELRDAFDVYDINGDGRISDAELSKVVSRIGEGLLVLGVLASRGHTPRCAPSGCGRRSCNNTLNVLFLLNLQFVATIFRAKVVDISENSLTLEVTGDPGKIVAAQRNLSKFGIKEICRTGKIALRREKIGATARFWGFSAASYPDLVEASRKNPLTSVNKTVNGSFDQPSSAGGDVYPVEPYESLSMNQVLDAHWGVLDDEDVVVWFSTGYITIKDMVVTGMPIKIVGVAALKVLLFSEVMCACTYDALTQEIE
ncbi:hypothetical protein ZWY2020_017502 [Hordeum vulgare]|nr:hypothetical protein ZWY2020_017502 [Hordeum vulgare]